MKPSLVTNLGLLLVSFSPAGLAGCATSDSVDDECLPGDIDCYDGSLDTDGDGKADAFDRKNDPKLMSQSLQYRLAELPMKGDRTTPVWKDQFPDAVGKSDVAWADTYWPTYEGSHNARWQSPGIQSPMEKYDAVFNGKPGCATQPARIDGPGAKAAWDEYYKCAGPAAKWQSQTFQNAGVLHDGIDNDGDGVIDDEGPDGDVDGVATWWGTCHAWAPASLLLPEPQHAVTMDGVEFSVGDIKALAQNIFDSTSAIMVGGRCNAKDIKHDPTTSANDACADLNPGALHVVMTNFLGIANLALIEDRTANFEIWNQAVMGYEITKQEKTTATAANQCVGATGDTWTYNPNAAELFDVRMTAKYLTESAANTRPVGSRNHIRTDRYHYILELNSAGKIVGGRYCTDSENNHVDFLWAPTGRFNPSNPFVKTSKVQELIAKSVAPEGGNPGGDAKVFTSPGGVAIPDNDPKGAQVDVDVSGVTGSVGLAVSVNITHTFRGDLVVELLKDGAKVKTLSDRQGGSADDLVNTFTLTAAEVGAPNGTWSLKVTDTAAIDTGTINELKLSFQ